MLNFTLRLLSLLVASALTRTNGHSRTRRKSSEVQVLAVNEHGKSSPQHDVKFSPECPTGWTYEGTMSTVCIAPSQEKSPLLRSRFAEMDCGLHAQVRRCRSDSLVGVLIGPLLTKPGDWVGAISVVVWKCLAPAHLLPCVCVLVDPLSGVGCVSAAGYATEGRQSGAIRW